MDLAFRAFQAALNSDWAVSGAGRGVRTEAFFVGWSYNPAPK